MKSLDTDTGLQNFSNVSKFFPEILKQKHHFIPAELSLYFIAKEKYASII